MSDQNIQYYTAEYHCKESIFDGQKLSISLAVQIKLQSFDGIDNKFLTVSLVNTQVAASTTGELIHNSEKRRAFFTEHVSVVIKVDHTNQLKKMKDIPNTTVSTGSYTTSDTIGISANAGTFNGDPTMNIGISSSSTHSATQTISDFTVSNLSTDNHVKHTYQLSSTPSGPYKSADSLKHSPSAGDFFHGLSHGTPNKDYYWTVNPPCNNDGSAISNLPIPSQGVWMTTKGDFNEKVAVTIKLEHALQDVSAEHKKLKNHFHYYKKDLQPKYFFQKEYVADFSIIKDPLIKEHS